MVFLAKLTDSADAQKEILKTAYAVKYVIKA